MHSYQLQSNLLIQKIVCIGGFLIDKYLLLLSGHNTFMFVFGVFVPTFGYADADKRRLSCRGCCGPTDEHDRNINTHAAD